MAYVYFIYRIYEQPSCFAYYVNPTFRLVYIAEEFLKFVRPIGPRGLKIMRFANNFGNAGPHVRQTFLNDEFTFLTEVGNAGRIAIVNTGTSSVNSEFVTAIEYVIFYVFGKYYW